MKKIFTLLTLVCFSAFSQNLTPEIICYASGKDEHTKVGVKPLSRRTDAVATSTINVRYIGFTPEAQAAFQYAIDQWEVLLKSSVTINIDAYWQPLDPGVLGSARANGYRRNFKGAPIPDIDYPLPLAEKLARKALNSSTESDIVCNFSSNINWYFGTDGNPGSGQYDLVSVVMHEIGHGLGVAGTFGGNETAKIANHSLITGFPGVYDYYVYAFGNQVINRDLFSTQSAIYTAVTSNNLQFRSPIGFSLNQNTYPPLYSPDPYNGGSSVSHLNESSYPAGNENSLMTPFVGAAEAIHHPGSVLLGMMAEMGWEYGFFDHVRLTDTEDELSDIEFKVAFSADMNVNNTTMKVKYQLDANQVMVVPMTLINGEFVATISNPGPGELSYWFEIEDEYGRILSSQSVENDFGYTIGPDLKEPIISLTEIKEVNLSGISVLPDFQVSYSDNIGIQSAKIEYSLNQGATNELDLLSGTKNIPIPIESLSFGDVIEYRLLVTDNSSNQNVSILPKDGFYKMVILDEVEEFILDLSSSSRVFSGDDFTAMADTQTGLAYHSAHPYTNNLDTFLNFRGDIQMDNQFVIVTWQDIAIIEPGVPGAPFGISAFRDYIALEASKDNGVTWTALEGYDANSDPNWLAVFNGNLEPSESLYKERHLVLNDWFAFGALVKLRFRLKSNETNAGWGWALKSFSIDRSDTNPDVILASEIQALIHPNPTSDFIKIPLLPNGIYEIHDQTGKLVEQGNLNNNINVSAFDKGVYVLTLYLENNQIINSRFIKK